MNAVNRLALGTVQFGMPYGVANTSGRVAEKEAKQIIKFASTMGLDTLDTAISYGESEKSLGLVGIQNWRVVSKLPAMPAECEDIFGWVATQIHGSLSRLGVERLTGVLLHRPEDLMESRGVELLSALKDLKQKGLVEKIGVSIYSPEQLGPLFDLETFDIVQAPLSILDRRLVDSGWAAQLQKAGVELHTRSAFLQGLLLMDPESRPKKFDRWGNVWRTWSQWLSVEGLSPLEACLRYPLSQIAVDRVIVGVDSLAQLEEILSAAAGGLSSLPEFGNIDTELINPSLWHQI